LNPGEVKHTLEELLSGDLKANLVMIFGNEKYQSFLEAAQKAVDENEAALVVSNAAESETAQKEREAAQKESDESSALEAESELDLASKSVSVI
jgi:hypothetical protein